MTGEATPNPATVAREHLLTVAVDGPIDRIESHRVTLRPGQRSGSHIHPGGVIGYIVDGEITFAIDGHASTMLHAGDVFYEPPGATIAHFDNASDVATATFIANYPLTGDQPLIVMSGAGL